MLYEMKKTDLRGVIDTAEFVGNTFYCMISLLPIDPLKGTISQVL